jgi:hypothetical protein
MTIFKSILIGTMILVLGPTLVNAQQVITTCGASKGKKYQLEPKKDGWIDDGISNGTLTFIQNKPNEYDIIIKDAITSFSVRGDGATVVKVQGSDNAVMTLVAIYPLHVTEVYQLTLDAAGRGTLIWAVMKNRTPLLGITSGATFISECLR